MKKTYGALILFFAYGALPGWHGCSYQKEPLHCGKRDYTGWSKYGNPRRGPIIDEKQTYWYGTNRIWWKGDTPYIRENGQWYQWRELFPDLSPPNKKRLITKENV